MSAHERNKTADAGDAVQEAVMAALSNGRPMEFNEVFAALSEELPAMGTAVNGGEEMLRMRCYERLQALIRDGLVRKNAKAYRAVAVPEAHATPARVRAGAKHTAARHRSGG